MVWISRANLVYWWEKSKNYGFFRYLQQKDTLNLALKLRHFTEFVS